MQSIEEYELRKKLERIIFHQMELLEKGALEMFVIIVSIMREKVNITTINFCPPI